jgi:DNA-directed RNA polymerase subunit RPC12/RpoP
MDDEVRDAVTGQPLGAERRRYRCSRCQLFYGASSVEFIRRENGGRCIGCGSAAVVPSDGQRVEQHVTPPGAGAATTVANYRRHVNQMVVFEGRCLQVLTSRSGTAYAVMFEPGTWTEGFKLVVRTAFVAEVGGERFIRSLSGQMIRARGVITHSPVFGYEIGISNRSMILGVW